MANFEVAREDFERLRDSKNTNHESFSSLKMFLDSIIGKNNSSQYLRPVNLESIQLREENVDRRSSKRFIISSKLLVNVNLSNSLNIHQLQNLSRLDDQICAYIIQFDLSNNRIISEGDNMHILINTIK